MKTQLSLFPKNVAEDRFILIAEGKTVTISFECKVCGKGFTIGPHKPIHSIEWMDRNWVKISERNYYVLGNACSRQCELKLHNQSAPPTTSPPLGSERAVY